MSLRLLLLMLMILMMMAQEQNRHNQPTQMSVASSICSFQNWLVGYYGMTFEVTKLLICPIEIKFYLWKISLSWLVHSAHTHISPLALSQALGLIWIFTWHIFYSSSHSQCIASKTVFYWLFSSSSSKSFKDTFRIINWRILNTCSRFVHFFFVYELEIVIEATIDQNEMTIERTKIEIEPIERK